MLSVAVMTVFLAPEPVLVVMAVREERLTKVPKRGPGRR